MDGAAAHVKQRQVMDKHQNILRLAPEFVQAFSSNGCCNGLYETVAGNGQAPEHCESEANAVPEGQRHL